MINEYELTILYQGRLNRDIEKCIDNVFIVFPNINEIIISTWEGEENRIKPIEKKYKGRIRSLFLKDPGSKYRKPKTLHNVNRIITSSKLGLDIVKTQYCIVSRSDIFFENQNIINLYNQYKENDKFLVLNQTSIDPERGPKLLYHLCDWLIMGKTNKLQRYYDIHHIPDDYCNWYEERSKPEDKIDPGNISRYMAEDYLTSKALNKMGYEIDHNFYCEYTIKEIQKWMEIIKKQYIIIPVKKSGLKNLSLTKVRDFHLYSSISFVKWKKISEINVSKIEISIDKIIYLRRFFLFNLWKIKNKFLET